jgi:preprotein translocase subunit SecE
MILWQNKYLSKMKYKNNWKQFKYIYAIVEETNKTIILQKRKDKKKLTIKRR